jgi:hypothetical protein
MNKALAYGGYAHIRLACPRSASADSLIAHAVRFSLCINTEKAMKNQAKGSVFQLFLFKLTAGTALSISTLGVENWIRGLFQSKASKGAHVRDKGEPTIQLDDKHFFTQSLG